MASRARFHRGLDWYLGIPWVLDGQSLAGCDCWGLVKLVYRTELGLDLVHPSAMPIESAAAVARRVAEVRELLLGEALFVPAEGAGADLDVLEFATRGRLADHVGVLANGMLLHARYGAGVSLTPFDRVRWPILSRWRLA